MRLNVQILKSQTNGPMMRYTINISNIFYFLSITALTIWILIAAKVILIPLSFSFFLP